MQEISRREPALKKPPARAWSARSPPAPGPTSAARSSWTSKAWRCISATIRPMPDHESSQRWTRGVRGESPARGRSPGRRRAGRHRGHQAAREALKDLGKEGRPQIATALKERFGAGRDPGIRRIPALQRVGQGFTQGLGGSQHDSRPEADQRLERPHPLSLGRPHGAKDGPTQGRRDVLLEQIHHSQQIDRLRATGHSPSL